MDTIAERAVRSFVGESKLEKFAELAARIMIATLFLISGVRLLRHYGETTAFMDSAGMPGELLPVVIALKIGGALALAVGWRTRLTSFLLAGFTLLAGIVFHAELDDPQQSTHFLKNVAIAGGLLLLVARGAGSFGLDGRERRAGLRGKPLALPRFNHEAARVGAELATLSPAQRALEDRLDSELDATFPASDPLPWRHGDRGPRRV